MVTKQQVEKSITDAIRMAENENDNSGFDGVITLIDDAWSDDDITEGERNSYYASIENYL